ncbi:MAG: rhodanese-like domain-containing protein [Gammaproteobacteria bacterium]|nr:MAG: rhodanese-like domain-containing protein [Gammaproteobacteria bacterium]
MEHFIFFVTKHWMLSGTFVALLIGLWMVERVRAGNSLSPQQVVLLLNRDEAVVIDIRDKKDFAEGHVKGAYHIPMAKVAERASELDRFKGKTIVIADKMGQHASSVTKQLREKGYDVVRMNGGIAEWQAQNLPLAKK